MFQGLEQFGEDKRGDWKTLGSAIWWGLPAPKALSDQLEWWVAADRTLEPSCLVQERHGREVHPDSSKADPTAEMHHKQSSLVSAGWDWRQCRL